MQDWVLNPSTKLQAMIDIARWHLAKDKRAPLQTDNGALQQGSDDLLPNPDGEPDKIVIYSYFVVNTTFISQVMSSLLPLLFVCSCAI